MSGQDSEQLGVDGVFRREVGRQLGELAPHVGLGRFDGPLGFDGPPLSQAETLRHEPIRDVPLFAPNLLAQRHAAVDEFQREELVASRVEIRLDRRKHKWGVSGDEALGVGQARADKTADDLALPARMQVSLDFIDEEHHGLGRLNLPEFRRDAVLAQRPHEDVRKAENSADASGGMNDASTVSAGYDKGMAVFTVAKGGLMYEAALAGQKYSYESL